MNTPSEVKVSVVIPCYNHGKEIKKAVASVLEQNYCPLELIIIDDASDESTKEALRSLKRSNIRVIHQDINRGPSAARNRGIAESRGEILLSLDADDAIRPDYIEKAIKVFETYPEVGVVTAGVQFHGERHSVWIPRGGELRHILVNAIPPTSFFRRKCWEEVGGYDESLRGAEDWDYWIKIAKKKWLIEAIPEVLIDFNYTDTGAHHKHVVADNSALKTVLEKHADAFGEHLIEVLLSLNMKSFEMVELERRSLETQRAIEALLAKKSELLEHTRAQLRRKNTELERATALHAKTKRSVSYRLGMNLTWPIRALLRATRSQAVN